MEIWLLRHAAAESRSHSGRDADRALTEEGRERAVRVGRGLAALDPGISRILSSPYLRARQTADAAAESLGQHVEESSALEPDADPAAILRELRSAEEGVLLVGHEPHLGALLGRLVHGAGGPPLPLKKAAVARVSREGHGGGTLRALLPASVLERLGR